MSPFHAISHSIWIFPGRQTCWKHLSIWNLGQLCGYVGIWSIGTETGPQFRWLISRFLKPNTTAALPWCGGRLVEDTLLLEKDSCPQNEPQAHIPHGVEKLSFWGQSIALYLLLVSSSLMQYKSNNVPGNELINSYSFYSIIKVRQDWTGI